MTVAGKVSEVSASELPLTEKLVNESAVNKKDIMYTLTEAQCQQLCLLIVNNLKLCHDICKTTHGIAMFRLNQSFINHI